MLCYIGPGVGSSFNDDWETLLPRAGLAAALVVVLYRGLVLALGVIQGAIERFRRGSKVTPSSP